MGSLLRDTDLFNFIRKGDDCDIFTDEEIEEVVRYLQSTEVGVRKVKHLIYLEVEDLPKHLSILKKRVLIYNFAGISNGNDYQPIETGVLDKGKLPKGALGVDTAGRLILEVNGRDLLIPGESPETDFISDQINQEFISDEKDQETISEKNDKEVISDKNNEEIISDKKDEEIISDKKDEEIISVNENYSPEHDAFLLNDGTEVKVLKMRSDGSCLFAAITHQVGSYIPHSAGHEAEIREARRATVRFLEQNWKEDETLKYNILDSISQSKLFDYNGLDEQGKIQSYLINLEDDLEWGGIEALRALAQHFDVTIRVFQEGEASFTVEPPSNDSPPEIMVGFRRSLDEENPGWNHYDSVISVIPAKSSDMECGSDKGDDRFKELRQFFPEDEWMQLSETEKVRYGNVYERYHVMKAKGFELKKPHFMEEKNTKTKAKGQPKKGASTPTRKSTRITNVNSPQLDTDKATRKPEKELAGQKPMKKPRLIGTQLTYPTALPQFGHDASNNLNKPAHLRKMNPILSECKQFIRTSIKGEYPSKRDYDAFSRTMVERYPLLKGDDTSGTESWWTFKKSLSASFRDERKKGGTKANSTKTQAKGTNANSTQSQANGVVSRLSENPEDQILELKGAKDKRTMARLLVKTKDIRRHFYANITTPKMMEEFPHLRIPEMLLLDYLSLHGFTLEDLEENLSNAIQLIGQHHVIDTSTEAGKMLAVNEMHKFFITKAVKEGAKPVYTLVNKQSALESMMSSPIQSPFLVVLIKDNPFVPEEKELQAAAIGLHGQMLVALNHSPSALRCLLTLLAAYHVYDLEYPFSYMEFMRALERLSTGSVVQSNYGNTRKKFDKYHSLINTEKTEKRTRTSRKK